MEGEGGGCQVDFEIFGKDVGGSDCDEYVVTFRVMLGGALGPDDCEIELVSSFL